MAGSEIDPYATTYKADITGSTVLSGDDCRQCQQPAEEGDTEPATADERAADVQDRRLDCRGDDQQRHPSGECEWSERGAAHGAVRVKAICASAAEPSGANIPTPAA